MAILITGGAGFIGSHVVRRMVLEHSNERIINLDNLTYAANIDNLKDLEQCENYRFVAGDICDKNTLDKIFEQEEISGIIHLAAESHVDRSINTPLLFAETNILGTLTLLETARKYWAGNFKSHRFYHISTDEVYGTLPLDEGLFTETTPYQPHSPYSASKASSDHFVRAYHDTYGMNTVISNCSNNYGPYQFPEKLIPLFINNILTQKALPIYGAGENVRDWLFVEDHAKAIEQIYFKGKTGETYNIGGNNEKKNKDLVAELISITDEILGNPTGSSTHLITYVTDRAGHDLRYAIDATKIKNDLGWMPETSFEEGLRKTISWYLSNQSWLEDIRSGNYQIRNQKSRKSHSL